MFHVDIFRLNAIFLTLPTWVLWYYYLTLTFHGRQFYLPTVACSPISHLNISTYKGAISSYLTYLKFTFVGVCRIECFCYPAAYRIYVANSGVTEEHGALTRLGIFCVGGPFRPLLAPFFSAAPPPPPVAKFSVSVPFWESKNFSGHTTIFPKDKNFFQKHLLCLLPLSMFIYCNTV
jgi:hypothetical protein